MLNVYEIEFIAINNEISTISVVFDNMLNAINWFNVNCDCIRILSIVFIEQQR